MKLKRFDIDFVRTLKTKVGQNLLCYRKSSYDINPDEIYDVPEVEIDSDLLDSLLENPADDFKNSKLVYEKLKGMNPLIASQEPVWVYLSHQLLFKYVQQRWPGVFKDDTLSETYVKKYWFGWKYNAIGRLWWNAYLTVDTDRKDPYELTEVLYKQSDITQNLSTSDVLFPNKNAISAILGFYKEHENEIFEPKSATNERNRFVTQSLNRWGGVKNLAYLSKEDFMNELSNNLHTIVKIMPNDKHNDFEWIQS